MGIRILSDRQNDMACLYCSTSDHAFGPVFYDNNSTHVDAEERAEAFLRWLDVTPTWKDYEKHNILDRGRHDARVLTDSGLNRAYSDWQRQESAQFAAEELKERAEANCDAHFPCKPTDLPVNMCPSCRALYLPEKGGSA